MFPRSASLVGWSYYLLAVEDVDTRGSRRQPPPPSPKVCGRTTTAGMGRRDLLVKLIFSQSISDQQQNSTTGNSGMVIRRRMNVIDAYKPALDEFNSRDDIGVDCKPLKGGVGVRVRRVVSMWWRKGEWVIKRRGFLTTSMDWVRYLVICARPVIACKYRYQ